MEGIALYNIGIELCVTVPVNKCLIYKIATRARPVKKGGGGTSLRIE